MSLKPAHTQVEAPRDVLAWLGFFYRRVLFPGARPAVSAWSWGRGLSLFGWTALLLYPCLGFHLFEPDEGRYAQIPREMLEAGEWIVPVLQGQPYLDKPPLFYWLVMGMYQLFGYHAWAARLVPALAVHLTVLLGYVLGRRMVGEQSAWQGMLLLAVSPLFVGMGRLVLLDGLLTLWVTLALFACYFALERERLHWGWWCLAALAFGLGILTKGPIALLLVVPPLGLHRLLAANSTRISWHAALTFLAIALGIALPWYVAVCVRQPDFAGYFFLKHNFQRFMQPFDHEEPVWFFVPILFVGLLPAVMLSRQWMHALLSGDDHARERRHFAQGYLWLCGLWCVFFFSLSGCKLPTYILPAFVPLGLAIGGLLTPSLLQRRVVAVAGGLMLAALYVVLPRYAEIKSPMARAEQVAALCEEVPVVCFPDNVDSVAFHLGRSDFKTFRSKELAGLLELLDREPKVTVLFAHRSSLELLRSRIPPHLRLVESHPMGLCDIARIERIHD